MRFPIDVQARAAIGISQSYCWHGVRQLRQRRIESYLVAANMVFAVDGAGLHGGELPGTQQSYAMTLWIHRQFHGHRNYLLGVTQKFSSHLMGECD